MNATEKLSATNESLVRAYQEDNKEALTAILDLNTSQRQRINKSTKEKLKNEFGHLIIRPRQERTDFNPIRLEKQKRNNNLCNNLNSFNNFIEYYNDLLEEYKAIDGYNTDTSLSLAKHSNRINADTTAKKGIAKHEIKEKIKAVEKLIPEQKKSIKLYIQSLFSKKGADSKIYPILIDMYVKGMSEKRLEKKYGVKYKESIYNFFRMNKNRKPIKNGILNHFTYIERPAHLDIYEILYLNEIESSEKETVNI